MSAGRKRPFVAGFVSSSDACVSFDGKRVLFSGKRKPAEALQIWELAIAGGEPRPVTSGLEDAIAPFYLPSGKLVYSRRTALGFQLEIMPLDGSTAPLRLTYAPGDHVATDILHDGRILFEAPFPDGTASKTRDIYTVYPDGSGVETYRCDHGRDRHGARELDSGDIVFESGGHLARFTSRSAVEAPFEASLRPEQRVVVRPRTPPKWFPSSLGDRNGANTLCLNVYTSKERIPDAIVNFVRVWARDHKGAPVALGEAPVERDGSFFVNVPSERPIRFELLDGNKKTVAAEQGWFWMRRGEQRVCVGCHAGPERAPDNAAPQILLRTTDPVKMELPK